MTPEEVAKLKNHLELQATEMTEHIFLPKGDRAALEYILRCDMTLRELKAHYDSLIDSDTKSEIGYAVELLKSSTREYPYIWSETGLQYNVEYKVTSACSFHGTKYSEGDVVCLEELGGPSLEVDTVVFCDIASDTNSKLADCSRFEFAFVVDGNTSREWFDSTIQDIKVFYTDPLFSQNISVQYQFTS